MMWIVALLAYLGMSVLLHAGLARAWPGGNRVRQFLAVGTMVGLVLFGHLMKTPELPLSAKAAIIACYAFGSELYIFVFTFATSSVTVALLLNDGPKHSATRLGPADMVQRRLDAMSSSGLLLKTGEKFELTPPGRRIVRAYRLLRGFFRHPSAP